MRIERGHALPERLHYLLPQFVALRHIKPLSAMEIAAAPAMMK